MGLFKNNTHGGGSNSKYKASDFRGATFADKRSDVLWSAEMYLIRAVSYTYRQAFSNNSPKKRPHAQYYQNSVTRHGAGSVSRYSKPKDAANV